MVVYHEAPETLQGVVIQLLFDRIALVLFSYAGVPTPKVAEVNLDLLRPSR
jgi:hypothetical protein